MCFNYQINKIQILEVLEAVHPNPKSVLIYEFM